MYTVGVVWLLNWIGANERERGSVVFNSELATALALMDRFSLVEDGPLSSAQLAIDLTLFAATSCLKLNDSQFKKLTLAARTSC